MESNSSISEDNNVLYINGFEIKVKEIEEEEEVYFLENNMVDLINIFYIYLTFYFILLIYY